MCATQHLAATRWEGKASGATTSPSVQSFQDLRGKADLTGRPVPVPPRYLPTSAQKAPDTERPSFSRHTSETQNGQAGPGRYGFLNATRGPSSQPAQPLGNPKTVRLGPGRYGFLGMGGRLCGGSVGDRKNRSHLVSSSRKLTQAYLRLSQAQMAAPMDTDMDCDCDLDDLFEVPPPPPPGSGSRPGKRDSTATSAADEVRRFTYIISGESVLREVVNFGLISARCRPEI